MSVVSSGPNPDAEREKHMLLREISTLDEVLHDYAAELGGDFTAYRNHAYRVANLCVALSSGDPGQLQKIAIAAAFHDMGIWTDGTFDYLQPSIKLAGTYLARSGRAEWTSEIAGMILEHHKITPYRDAPDLLVEPFRRADWVDVSRGLIAFGLSRALLGEIFSTWPNTGFHKLIFQLALKRLLTHPLSPLPMMRL
jgi:hypothetical protein